MGTPRRVRGSKSWLLVQNRISWVSARWAPRRSFVEPWPSFMTSTKLHMPSMLSRTKCTSSMSAGGGTWIENTSSSSGFFDSRRGKGVSMFNDRAAPKAYEPHSYERSWQLRERHRAGRRAGGGRRGGTSGEEVGR